MSGVRVRLMAGAVITASYAFVVPLAQAGEGKPILDIRLRAEQVDQSGLDETTALTARGRVGYDYKANDTWSFLGEVEGVAHLNDDFSDTVNSVAGKAIVADPEAFEINRLQVAWKDKAGSVTLGRQRIILDDARFVGNVGFRQNEQTFDALRLGHVFPGNVSVDYVYIDKVHRVFGDDSPVGAWDSASHILRLSTETSFGDMTAYGLLLDFDDAPAASGQTWGASWTKSLDTDLGKVALDVEAAVQSEWNGQGPESHLGYQSASISMTRQGVTGALGLEILEGAGGRGFATPLATLHAFQGWADVFLTTPASGVRDISARLKGRAPAFIPGGQPLAWVIAAHDFSSDNAEQDIGRELDALVRLPLNAKLNLEGKVAIFDGDTGGPADRTKFWLALEASF
jgi:hypothetical protein